MNKYIILPFRYTQFSDSSKLIINEAGEYFFLSNQDFNNFVEKRMQEIEKELSCHAGDPPRSGFQFEMPGRTKFQFHHHQVVALPQIQFGFQASLASVSIALIS